MNCAAFVFRSLPIWPWWFYHEGSLHAFFSLTCNNSAAIMPPWSRCQVVTRGSTSSFTRVDGSCLKLGLKHGKQAVQHTGDLPGYIYYSEGIAQTPEYFTHETSLVSSSDPLPISSGLHSKQYRFLKKNPSVLYNVTPGEPLVLKYWRAHFEEPIILLCNPTLAKGLFKVVSDYS